MLSRLLRGDRATTSMRTAYAVSLVGHVAILVWSVWSFAAKPLAMPAAESLSVDVVSAAEFSNITAGSKSAPKLDNPKPLVEKVAEAKPLEDPAAKVVEKNEVKAAQETAPATEAKPTPSKTERKQPESKPDPAAEAAAKQEPKSEAKRAEAPWAVQ